MKILLSDSDWSSIDGEVCKILSYLPEDKTEVGRLKPYASIVFLCSGMDSSTKGLITQKEDFRNLNRIYNERNVASSEEVIFTWTRKKYRGVAKLFSIFLPKMHFMVCPKGAYDLITNSHGSPELTGEARALAICPIVEFKPEVML